MSSFPSHVLTALHVFVCIGDWVLGKEEMRHLQQTSTVIFFFFFLILGVLLPNRHKLDLVDVA